ncbi:recombinase family protein [Flavobacterium johnsoniae]|uniref:Resolvase, N terminal domain n=1 Tax=Flavobacterium johnsoniae TaxID=986 RepID=A0A1M5TJM8_FLAJO|nr:recombinase family protein [Flavobacterium johnsoniae]SHH50914.1 Resolvase, N terminal domain [Flavobacterium johnsoniae]
MIKYVAYVRVSTIKQDLGLESQLNIINNYINKEDEILKIFTEKESGRDNNRIELGKAIEYTKNNNAILLIAKLDRLSRNVMFISTLMDSKVDFKACDIPTADNFTIHIFAALAEREVGIIRERTKNALSVIKTNIEKNGYHISKKGNMITSLGKNELKKEDWQKGQLAIKEKRLQNQNLKKAKAFANVLKGNGLNYVQITKLLNENGFKTSKGKDYMNTSTIRLFKE